MEILIQILKEIFRFYIYTLFHLDFFISVFLLFFVFLINFWHFKLLKKLFPKTLKNVSSFLEFLLPWNFYSIPTKYRNPFFIIFIPEKKFPQKKEILFYYRRIKNTVIITLLLFASLLISILIFFAIDYIFNELQIQKFIKF